jgi:hypothetical protein
MEEYVVGRSVRLTLSAMRANFIVFSGLLGLPSLTQVLEVKLVGEPVECETHELVGLIDHAPEQVFP